MTKIMRSDPILFREPPVQIGRPYADAGPGAPIRRAGSSPASLGFACGAARGGQGLSVPARHQLRGQARHSGARQLSDRPGDAVSSPAWAHDHDHRPASR
jgi:hypothetical protein